MQSTSWKTEGQGNPKGNPLVFQLSRRLGSETSEDFCLSPELTCKLTRSQVVLIIPLCFSGYYVPICMCLLKDTNFIFLEAGKWKSLRRVQLCDPIDSTVHGILQVRILEWVAVPFSRGSSQPRDRSQVSRSATDSLPAEPPGVSKMALYRHQSIWIFGTQKCFFFSSN